MLIKQLISDGRESYFYEANISTKQYKEVSCPRFSGENEHQGRKEGSREKEGQRAEKARGITRRMVRSLCALFAAAVLHAVMPQDEIIIPY